MQVRVASVFRSALGKAPDATLLATLLENRLKSGEAGLTEKLRELHPRGQASLDVNAVVQV